MINYVVQAHALGLGFVDCRTAETLEEAKTQEAALLADDNAWMRDTKERRTRIVPVAESRCADRYNCGRPLHHPGVVGG